VDVPGHVGFIRNMVAGAQGVDVVILVVAADDGVMPQTREHLDILTLMGVRHGLIALTKIDLVDEEMRDLAAGDVRDFTAGTFLADAPICPISNITGEGYEGFFAALDEAVAACRPRELSGLFRLWIERVFTIHGFGTVISGIPSDGEVREGERVELLPEGRTARVRKLQVYGENATVGRAGECVAINLTDIDAAALGRGKLLAAAGAFSPETMVEADLGLLPTMPRALPDYAEVHVHVGTAEVMANVAMLAGEPLAPGARQAVQLRMQHPLALAPGERFVLRANMPGAAGGKVTTVGGGRILDTSGRRLGRKREWVLSALSARLSALDSPPAWCELNAREAGEAVAPADVAQRAKMPLERVEPLVAALLDEGILLDAGDGKVVHRDVVDDLGKRIAGALQTYHAANPMRLGLPAGDLAAAVSADGATLAVAADGPTFAVAVRVLEADGTLERHEGLLALAGCEAKVPPAEVKLAERIGESLRAAGLAAPTVTELAESIGEPIERIEAMIALLADQGTVVPLDRRVVLHREAVEAAKGVALELFSRSPGFTTMEFRDAVGASRKYAVPLLDYFDSIRLTVRSGSRRTPGAEAKKRLAERAGG